MINTDMKDLYHWNDSPYCSPNTWILSWLSSMILWTYGFSSQLVEKQMFILIWTIMKRIGKICASSVIKSQEYLLFMSSCTTLPSSLGCVIMNPEVARPAARAAGEVAWLWREPLVCLAEEPSSSPGLIIGLPEISRDYVTTLSWPQCTVEM